MRRFFLSLLLIPLLILCIDAAGQSSDESQVRATFARYKSAILHDNPDEALEYVDSRTIAYYSHVLERVKNAGEAEVKALPLLDKLMVLTVRHKMEREDLLSFDGKGLLAHAIRTGLVGKNSVANLSLGEVFVENHFARAQLAVDNAPALFYFHFYREEEKWKIDLTSLFPTTSEAIRQMIKESGQGEDEFILSMIEKASGRAPEPTIWNAL